MNLDKLIKIGVIVCFLSLLVVNPLNIFPGVFTKAIIFQIAVEITLLLVLFKGDLRFSKVFFAFSGFILILLVSSVFGLNPSRSFFGTSLRMDGVFSLIHYLAFLFVLTNTFQSEKERLTLLKFVVFLSVFMAVVGLGQKIGTFDYWASSDNPDGSGFLRVSSTTGNPNFYAGFLIPVIFISFYIFLKEKKIFFLFTGLLNVFMLILTGSRGAWIGLGFGLLCLAILERKRISLRSVGVWALVSFSIFFLVLLFAKESVFVDRYLSLVSSIFQFQNERFILWKIAWQAFLKSPILGYGAESFSAIYAKSDLINNFSDNSFFDRLHNKFLEILLTSGILGFLSFLGVFILFLKNKDNRQFLPLLIAYFCQNIFSFDTISSWLILILVLSFDNSVFSLGDKKRLAFYSFLPFALYSFVFLNIRPYSLNLKLVKGERLFVNGYLEESKRSFDEFFSKTDFTSLEGSYYGLSFMKESSVFKESNYAENDLIGSILLEAAEKLGDSLNDKNEIKQLEGYLLLAETYRDFYKRNGDPVFLEKAETFLKLALTLNDNFARTYRLLSQLEFLKGDEEKGIGFLEKSYQLDRDYVVFNEWLGTSLMETEYKKEGAFYLRKAMRIGNFYREENFNEAAVSRIAKVYEDAKDYRSLMSFYEEVIGLYPKVNPQVYGSLCVVYAKIGQKDKAVILAEKLFSTFPQLKGKEEFIEKLKAESN